MREEGRQYQGRRTGSIASGSQHQQHKIEKNHKSGSERNNATTASARCLYSRQRGSLAVGAMCVAQAQRLAAARHRPSHELQRGRMQDNMHTWEATCDMLVAWVLDSTGGAEGSLCYFVGGRRRLKIAWPSWRASRSFYFFLRRRRSTRARSGKLVCC